MHGGVSQDHMLLYQHLLRESPMNSTTNTLQINVSGTPFTIPKDQIQLRDPVSRLFCICNVNCNLARKLADGYDEENMEYFFARSPTAFYSILSYYRTGDLHVPGNDIVCLVEFLKELKYWNIGLDKVARCCHNKVPYKVRCPPKDTPSFLKPRIGQVRQSLIQALSHPGKSKLGYGIQLVNAFFIVLSAFLIIVESYTDSAIELCSNNLTRFGSNSSTGSRPPYHGWPISVGNQKSEFIFLNMICVFWFTFDLGLQFYASVEKLKTARAKMTILTIFAIAPFYLNRIIELLFFCSPATAAVHDVMSFLRVTRILLITKLLRHHHGGKVMYHALKSSTPELLFLVTVIAVANLMLATLMYSFERDQVGGDFDNIGSAMYWSLITLTTVGYGDLVPKGPAGMILACVATLLGVIILSFPVSVVVTKFNEAFAERHIKMSLHEAGIYASEYWKRPQNVFGMLPQPDVLCPEDADSTKESAAPMLPDESRINNLANLSSYTHSSISLPRTCAHPDN